MANAKGPNTTYIPPALVGLTSVGIRVGSVGISVGFVGIPVWSTRLFRYQHVGIREIPDHATFRVKEHTPDWLDKLGGYLSLTLCNLANFDLLSRPKYRYFHLNCI